MVILTVNVDDRAADIPVTVIRAKEMVETLVTAVSNFTGDVDQADDLTILVAKRMAS